MTDEERKKLQETIFRLSKEKLELQAENEKLKQQLKEKENINESQNI